MAKRKSNSSALSNRKGTPVLALVIATLLYFFTVCLTSSSTSHYTGMVLIVLGVAALIVRFKKIRDMVCLPMVLLAAFVLMDGISTLYAVSGKFALYEFLKVISSFNLAIILLAVAPGKDSAPGRWIAKVLAGYAAISGILSIDLLSTRWISGFAFSILGRFTPDYTGLEGLEVGVRMVSIYDNPNIFAGVVGLGVLLSLGLVTSSQDQKERAACTVLLYINALSFLLAFSMGATASILAAFLMLLILEQKERRAGLFVLMIETLVLTFVSVFLISFTSFTAWTGVRPIPLLCVIAGSALLAVLDGLVGQKAGAMLAKKMKLLPIVIAVFVVLMLIFMIVAMNLTGSINLDAGEALRRAAYPDPGTYTLAVETDRPLSLTIESQNRQETMMHTSTILYSGDAANAAFTVPEDSLVVYFNFAAPEGAAFTSASYSGDAGSGSLPLDYKLLPGFIANRLQGLMANENAIQRLVFFEDGLKLVKRSPIIGLGMGVFENSIRNVQTFFYETKYAHNHYIQVLAEVGIVGLLLFVSVLVSAAAAVFFERKKGMEAHPLTAALGAGLVFMAAHAATEVVFSAFSYLPIAIGTLMLISLCCGKAIPVPEIKKKIKTIGMVAVCVLICGFGCLLSANLAAAWMVDSATTLANLDRGAGMDPFEWADYALSYVVNAPNNTGGEDGGMDPAVREKADHWAEELRKVDSNTIPFHLARYYFLTGRQEDAFAMIEKYTNYTSSDPDCWQESFDLMLSFYDETSAFRQQVLHIADNMEQWNTANMGSLTLAEGTNQTLQSFRDMEAGAAG